MATKRNSIAKRSVDPVTGIVTFTFSDSRVLTCDPAQVPSKIHVNVMANGISQKVGDSFAGAEDNPETGESALDVAYNDAKETIDQLYAGVWSAKRAAGEPRIGQLVEALARVSGKDVAVCKAVVEAMTDEQKKAIRADARIKQAIAEIALARANADAAKAGPSVLDSLLF